MDAKNSKKVVPHGERVLWTRVKALARLAQDVKKVLLVDAEMGGAHGMEKDALLLAKLEHIQRSAEARLHTFREIPKNLLQVGMAGFCASLVMGVLSLLPTTWGNAQRIAGVSITMVVGVSKHRIHTVHVRYVPLGKVRVR